MANVTGLHDLFQQVRAILYGVWRKRWPMVICAWVVSLAAWAVVFSMPYRYTSSAQVFVDTQTALPAIARNLGIPVNNVLRQIELVRQTLVSRPNLEKIIKRSDYLDRYAQSGAQIDAMVAKLQNNIRVVSLKNNMFRIEFTSDFPQLSDRQRAEVARTVVNNLLAFFLERNAEEGQQKSQDAEIFLDKQIADYAKRLESADQSLAVFRQSNLAFLGGQNSYLSRLQSEQGRLRSTQQDIIELKVSLSELEKQMAAVPPTIRLAGSSGRLTDGQADPLDERITELERQLDKLRAFGYTDKFPDVAQTLMQLETLKKEKAAQVAEMERQIEEAAKNGQATTRADETSNPVYEQIYLQVVEGRQALARLNRREEEQKLLVGEMEARAKRVPEVEAEEKRLSRDYNTLQTQYNELLREREDLQLKMNVEGVDENLTLQIIEPPVVPQTPSGPPRPLYLGFGLFVGIVSGLGLAFLLSQLRPVILSVSQLRTGFDLPILGSVTHIMSQEDIKGRSMDYLMFAGASIGLVVVFLALVGLDISGAMIGN